LLTKNEIGLWYFSLGLISLNLLLDLGMQVSFTRYFGYAKNGITDLRKSEKAPVKYLDTNKILLGRLVFSAALIYALISIISSIIISWIGYKYSIKNFSEFENINFGFYWTILGFLCFSQLSFQWVNAFLIAYEKISNIYKLQIVSKLSSFLIIPLLFFWGAEIFAISIGLLIGQLIQITLLIYFFVQIIKKIGLKITIENPLDIYKQIFSNITQIALFSVSQYLLLRVNIFFVTEKYGLEVAGDFGIIFQIATAIWHISKIKYQNTIPDVVSKINNGESLRIISTDNCKFYILLYLTGSIALIALLHFYPSLLNINLNFITITAVLLLLLLEGNTSNYCMLISYGNEIPYLKPYLISAFFYVTIVFVTIEIAFSLTVLISFQIIVQSAYNYWYWPRYLARRYYL
jgi:hypothetical protein